ncbi:hypothetical protein [Sneathiella limimaris]|uniref:hypothetical protein n=1 Tax=Sneathiella limimaris TaxID=1964213 RepID=UPI00146E40F6|nr:hypothetical protein [Sneathiella limimaris]
MAQASSHFEIHGRQSNSWTVQRVCDDRQTAVDSAAALLKDIPLKAVKVLQVSYGDGDEGFKDKEVYFAGEKADPKSSKSSDYELILPICKQASDLFRQDARRAIFNQLNGPLKGWNLIPIELLYHAENLQKLNDTGQILQGAVQKIAISQVQKTGQKVNERVLELYNLTNEVLKDLKVQRQTEDFLEVDETDLETLYRQSAEKDDPEKAFMSAFCRYTKGIKTLDQKYEKILELVADNDDSGVLKYLDKWLADFLISGENVRALVGSSENMGDGILRLLEVIKAKAGPKADSHVVLPAIVSHIKQKRLPETQKALLHKVMTTLQGNASFVKDDPFKSVLYHKRILKELEIKGGSHIGGQECVDALKERCERMTGSTSIAAFLEGYDHSLDRIDRLVQIAGGIIGASNMRTIANYIIPILETPFNRNEVVTSGRDHIETLKKICRIQTGVRRAGFQDFFADRMAKDLDDLAIELYEANNVEGNLENAYPQKVQLGLMLLRGISEGAFSEPMMTQRIRSFAKSVIMSKDFMIALHAEAKSGDAHASVLAEFTTLLERTRIDR